MGSLQGSSWAACGPSGGAGHQHLSLRQAPHNSEACLQLHSTLVDLQQLWCSRLAGRGLLTAGCAKG